MRKVLKCFDAVPTIGARYTVTIHSDVTDNNDPSKVVSLSGGDAGHVFVTLQKVNGTSSATKTFGFYPHTAIGDWVSLTNANTGSMIVDDGGHEYNGKMQSTFTDASRFNAAVTKAIDGADTSYNLYNFNCVDFGTSIWNAANPSTPINVMPSSWTIFNDVGKTPAGLLYTLASMKVNHPEIVLTPSDKPGYAPPKSGECP